MGFRAVFSQFLFPRDQYGLEFRVEGSLGFGELMVCLLACMRACLLSCLSVCLWDGRGRLQGLGTWRDCCLLFCVRRTGGGGRGRILGPRELLLVFLLPGGVAV